MSAARCGKSHQIGQRACVYQLNSTCLVSGVLGNLGIGTSLHAFL